MLDDRFAAEYQCHVEHYTMRLLLLLQMIMNYCCMIFKKFGLVMLLTLSFYIKNCSTLNID